MISQADPTGCTKIVGKDAVEFFQRSGVSNQILKEIWVIASSNGEFLDRDEFYVYLRLVGYAQNNIPVSSNSIL